MWNSFPFDTQVEYVESRNVSGTFCVNCWSSKMSNCGNKVVVKCKESKFFVFKFLCNAGVLLCAYVCIFSSVIKTRLIYDWHGCTTWPPNTARYVVNSNKSFVSLCVAFRFPFVTLVVGFKKIGLETSMIIVYILRYYAR